VSLMAGHGSLEPRVISYLKRSHLLRVLRHSIDAHGAIFVGAETSALRKPKSFKLSTIIPAYLLHGMDVEWSGIRNIKSY
jgi:hypothetical protein